MKINYSIFFTYKLVSLKFISIFQSEYFTNPNMNHLINSTYRIISNHGFAERRQKISNNQNALFALQPFQPLELVSPFSAGVISAEPTYLTIQLSVRKHITMQPEFLQYINHSCEPNVFFDTTLMEVIALKELKPGDEMTFFYPSSEWKMARSFDCYCGSPKCIKKIRGAAYLSPELQSQYRFTDFIQQQLAKKNTRKKVA